MDILIRGMEMPEGRPVCIVIDAAGQARRYDLNNDRYADDKLFEATNVPPHGRLGDLDRILADNEIYYNQLGRPGGGIQNSYMAVKRSIELASTVIPAEPQKEGQE